MKSAVAFFEALVVALATALASSPVSAQAQSSLFTFTKLLDTNATLPGAGGLYRGTEGPPAIEGGRVAFWAYNDIGEGVYAGTINGGITRVADTTTLIPGAEVPFEAFDFISIDQGRVAFNGWGYDEESNYYQGIYRFDDNALTRIMDLNTPVPGRTGGFLELWSVASSGHGQIAFGGVDFDDLEEGVYRGDGGPLVRVADTRTRVPGRAENFDFFYGVSAKENTTAFIASSESADGVYLHDSATGVVSVVADTSMPVPGRDEEFIAFGDGGVGGLDLHVGSGVFIGQFDTGRLDDVGVYAFDSNSLAIRRVADTSMQVPGRGDDFREAFTSVAIDSGFVAIGYGFEANPRIGTPQTPHFGVYTDLGGALESLLRAGDTLDGKLVSRAYVGADGLDGDQIAMSVVFSDGSEGIYVATLIPEPATIAFLLSCVAFLAMVAMVNVAYGKVSRSAV
jgi:hypothetical protein